MEPWTQKFSKASMIQHSQDTTPPDRLFTLLLAVSTKRKTCFDPGCLVSITSIYWVGLVTPHFSSGLDHFQEPWGVVRTPQARVNGCAAADGHNFPTSLARWKVLKWEKLRGSIWDRLVLCVWGASLSNWLASLLISSTRLPLSTDMSTIICLEGMHICLLSPVYWSVFHRGNKPLISPPIVAKTCLTDSKYCIKAAGKQGYIT